MPYAAPIRRINTAKGHYYKDADGQRVPGVTTIIGDGLPKPALMNWGPKVTAEYAVDRWDDLANLSPSARLKRLEGARWEDRDTAAKQGTRVHALAEQLVKGEEVEVPDELAGHVESYVQLIDSFRVTAVMTEFSVINYTAGYAGTADGILDIPGRGRLLADIKTSRSGIFGDVALQLSAYRYAEVYLDPETGEEKPMIPVDGCVGIHVRADGADIIPVTTGHDQYMTFRYVQQVGRFVKDSRDLVGAPLDPPTTTPRRRLEIAQETAA